MESVCKTLWKPSESDECPVQMTLLLKVARESSVDIRFPNELMYNLSCEQKHTDAWGKKKIIKFEEETIFWNGTSVNRHHDLMSPKFEIFKRRSRMLGTSVRV